MKTKNTSFKKAQMLAVFGLFFKIKLLVVGFSGFLKQVVEVTGCFSEYDFLGLPQYSQENTCVGVSFNKVAALKASRFIKKKLQHWCFPVNIGKFLRAVLFY